MSLGTLLLAAQFADLLWPTLVLLGIENAEVQPGSTVVTPLSFISYPYSHSLVALIVWAILLGFGYILLRDARAKVGLVVGALVLSHWVLDVVSHRPDMPLAIGAGPKVGLGLWNSLPGTLATELVMFTVGVGLYATCTKAFDRRGTIGLWALVIFLSVIYFANMFGPPPPSATLVAWSGEAMWLIILWGYWVDRHRQPSAG